MVESYGLLIVLAVSVLFRNFRPRGKRENWCTLDSEKNVWVLPTTELKIEPGTE